MFRLAPICASEAADTLANSPLEITTFCLNLTSEVQISSGLDSWYHELLDPWRSFKSDDVLGFGSPVKSPSLLRIPAAALCVSGGGLERSQFGCSLVLKSVAEVHVLRGKIPVPTPDRALL